MLPKNDVSPALCAGDTSFLEYLSILVSRVRLGERSKKSNQIKKDDTNDDDTANDRNDAKMQKGLRNWPSAESAQNKAYLDIQKRVITMVISHRAAMIVS